jgi:hypothetical protein
MNYPSPIDLVVFMVSNTMDVVMMRNKVEIKMSMRMLSTNALTISLALNFYLTFFVFYSLVYSVFAVNFVMVMLFDLDDILLT